MSPEGLSIFWGGMNVDHHRFPLKRIKLKLKMLELFLKKIKDPFIEMDQ